MATVIEALGAIDLGPLTLRLTQADDTVRGDLLTEIRNLDPRALLGDLGETLRGGGLPSDPEALRAALGATAGQLDGIIAWPDIPVIGDVAERLESLIALLEEQIERLGLDQGGPIVDRLLGGAGGLDQVLGELVGLIASAFRVEIPDIAREPIAALESLARGQPRTPDELAQLLSRFVVGFDLAKLGAPARRLEDFLGDLRGLGGSFGSIDADIAGITGGLRHVEVLLHEPEVDVAQAVAALGAVGTRLDLLFHNEIPGALGRLTGDLAALDARSFTEAMETALTPLAFRGPPVAFDLERDFMEGFRTLEAFIDAADETAFQTGLDTIAAEFAGLVAESGVEDLPRAINGFIDEIIEQVRRVPLRDLRDDLIDGLNAIEARVRGFEGFDAPRQFGDQLRALEAQIDGIDLAAIQAKVDEFAATLQQAVDGFPIQAIADEVQGLTGQVSEALEQFVPAVKELSGQLEEIAGEAGRIDLSAAGKASIDLIGDIRGQVADLASSDDLPEAAKVAIAAAAAALERIDVTVEVRAPFQTALDQIDAKAVLAPLDGVLETVRAALSKATPQALVERLEGPFESLLAELERLRPAALLAGLSAQFQDLVARVQALDPGRLVAPLEAQFQALLARLRSAADPAPLFAPLKAAYRGLLELLELLDLRKLIDAVVRTTAELPGKLNESLRGSLEGGLEAGATLPDTDPGARQFRLGDVLRPLALLLFRLRNALLRLGGEVIDGALGLIAAPLGALRGLVEEGGGVIARVVEAVEERMRALDPLTAGGPAAELRRALQDVALAADGAALSVEGRVELEGSLAAVQLDLRVEGTALSRQQAEEELERLRARLHEPGLGRLIERLRGQLGALVPAPLLEGGLAGSAHERLAALLDELDPAPLIEELDDLGPRVQAKVEQFADTIARGLIKVWDTLVTGLSPLMPAGLLELMGEAAARLRAEFEVLDPAVIESEVADLLDAVIDGLAAFSPARLADELGLVFDGALAKLQALDPAALLANLDPLANVIAGFEALRPSAVLAPLLATTEELSEAFEAIVSVDITGPLVEAVARLKAQLEEIIAAVESELRALLADLRAMAGGGAGVSLSVG